MTINTLPRATNAPAPTPAPTPAPAPAPPPAPPPPAGKDVDFSYNSQDTMVMPAMPTTIKGVIAAPDGSTLEVAKADLPGGLKPDNGKYVFNDSDPRYPAALSFGTVAKTIANFGEALGQPINWAFDGKLDVHPDAGEDFNAYYARDDHSVNFFHGTDPVTQAVVYSGTAGEVVSHENGHAILDGLRPGYFSSFTPDVGAFHEAFGDMMGMCMAFQDDRARARVAVQTGGDLSKPNVIANLGEALGIAINDVTGTNATLGGDYVRTALNNFKWVDPSTLPGDAPADQLSSEVHSFSRLWTGAFYDVLQGIQKENMAKGMTAQDALKATGQEAIQLLAELVKGSPQGDFTYKDMANAWIAADKANNKGKRADLITKVMTDRGIIPAGQPTPAPAPAPTPAPAPSPAPPNGHVIFTSTAAGRLPLDDVTRTVRTRLTGDQFGIFEGAVVDTVVDKDGSLSKDAELTTRTRSNLSRLIGQGRIRYNPPGYIMKKSDYFDAQGRPYTGYVSWDGDQMVVEHSHIVN